MWNILGQDTPSHQGNPWMVTWKTGLSNRDVKDLSDHRNHFWNVQFGNLLFLLDKISNELSNLQRFLILSGFKVIFVEHSRLMIRKSVLFSEPFFDVWPCSLCFVGPKLLKFISFLTLSPKWSYVIVFLAEHCFTNLLSYIQTLSKSWLSTK